MTPFDGRRWILGARWIFPVSGPPLEDGVITIEGGRIVSAEHRSAARPDIYFDSAAITPGFVNAHSHLDLTGLRGRCPPCPDFTSWLRNVIEHRRQRVTEDVHADIARGLAESVASGTTLLGDISFGGLSWPILRASPIRAVVFLELLGLTQEKSRQAESQAQIWLEGHPETSTCRAGLSPHAPYSVHRKLFASAAEQGCLLQVPLATHLAETKAELQLLSSHTGPFVPFLQELGVWNPEGLCGSPENVLQFCARARTLLVHGNYLDARVQVPSSHTVIYCPRTHAAFGHEPHPFLDLLKHGVRIALGTDSLASNPDLDLFAEARFLHRCLPDTPGEVLLRMATLAGAEALGWGLHTGSLEPGKSADLVVIPLSSLGNRDPHALLLESAEPPLAVLCQGRWVHQRSAVPGPCVVP
jgi:cytosine/adenosine deaminase-related metal-dependent hydrolase